MGSILPFNLETAVKREKDAQHIDVQGEAEQFELFTMDGLIG